MLRRVLVGGLLAASVIACGGGEPTPSPEPVTPAPTLAPVDTAPPELPVEPSEAVTSSTAAAACDAVGLRKSPSTTGALVGRINRGTEVRVAETVAGDAYTAGSCGAPGDTWHKIDRIAGKSARSLYGVQFVYSAAGFYE
jgi:hypothetical protein